MRPLFSRSAIVLCFGFSIILASWLLAQETQPTSAADNTAGAVAAPAATDSSSTVNEPKAAAPAESSATTESAPAKPATEAEPTAESAPTTKKALDIGTNSKPAVITPDTKPAESAPVVSPIPKGDHPGEWFKEAVKKGNGDEPVFLGTRFADATRAVIIEAPDRVVKAGVKMEWYLWVCNDLQQPFQGQVSYSVKQGDTPVDAGIKAVELKGGESKKFGSFTYDTSRFKPGIYHVEATLKNGAEKPLHTFAEIITVERNPNIEKRLAAETAALALAKEAAEVKAKKEAETRALEDAKEKAVLEATAKREAKLKAENEAKIQAEAAKKRQDDELKAKKAAEAKLLDDAKKKAAAEEKLKQEEAAIEAKVKADAEKKAAAAARQKQDDELKARKAAEKQAALEAKAKADADKKAATAAKKKQDDELKARKAAEKQAALEAKAKADADKKAADDAKLKADKAKKEAEAARKEAEKKAEKDLKAKREAELKQAAQEAKIKKEADQKALTTLNRKTQKEAKAKGTTESAPTSVIEPAKTPVSRVEKTGQATAPASAGTSGASPTDWRMSAGVMRRSIKGESLSSSSYSKDYPIASQAQRRNSAYDGGGGGGTGDRAYDNGYVRNDEFTSSDGNTWNWGYDSPNQVDGDKVRFQWVDHITTDFSRKTTQSELSHQDNSDAEYGWYLQVERVLKRQGPLDVGLHLDFGRASFSTTASGSNFRDEQSWTTWRNYTEDTYSLAGTGITRADSPYRGNYNDPGPTLNNIPEIRRSAGRDVIDSGSYLAYNAIQEWIDMNLNTLSMGLSASAECWRLRLTGITGPTFNIIETDASYQETLYQSWNDGRTPSVLKEWNETTETTEGTFGYFLQGQLAARIYRGLELGMFGRYDWIENVAGTVGASRYVINPEGASMGGMMTLGF